MAASERERALAREKNRKGRTAKAHDTLKARQTKERSFIFRRNGLRRRLQQKRLRRKETLLDEWLLGLTGERLSEPREVRLASSRWLAFTKKRPCARGGGSLLGRRSRRAREEAAAGAAQANLGPLVLDAQLLLVVLQHALEHLGSEHVVGRGVGRRLGRREKSGARGSVRTNDGPKTGRGADADGHSRQDGGDRKFQCRGSPATQRTAWKSGGQRSPRAAWQCGPSWRRRHPRGPQSAASRACRSQSEVGEKGGGGGGYEPKP